MIEQKPLEKTPKKSKMVLGDVAEDVVIKKEKKNKKKKKENKEMERDAELDGMLMAAQKTVDEKAEKKRKKALLQEKDSEEPQKKKKKTKREKSEAGIEAEIEAPVKMIKEEKTGEADQNIDPVDAKKSKKKRKKSSGITTSVNETGDTETVLEPLNSGKGPKIIIAWDKPQSSESSTPSKKKKNKKEKGGEDRVHETKGMNKALAYLKQWKEDKSSWKFEKCRQIWLLHNCYDTKRINEANFSVLLEYIASVKGAMREVVKNAALAKINKAEETPDDAEEAKDEGETKTEEEEEEKESKTKAESLQVVSQSDLKRAKQILDILET